MSSTDNNDEGQHSCSDPRPIPREPSLKLNNTAQCASFVSQRSSSIDTFGSISPTDNPGETFPDSAGQDGEEFASTPPPNRTLGKKSPALGEEGGTAGGEGDASMSDRWLCNNEAMPASMLHPSHRSTPMKDNREYLSAAREGEEVSAARVEEEGDRASDDEEGRPSREIFFPGDLQTPITGYETMEARSKFTVYKIHVQKAGSESEPEGWFIFRRYSDFLHLNERLKHLFPGFRLSLPPKRWFRDNFDMNFLEDRMLGLQAFLDNIVGHKEICNSEPVRAFFCTDEPPGPHDSLEESRALCDTLEESIYGLRQELTDKDAELALLKEEVALYKSQVEILSEQLKKVTGIAPSIAAGKGGSLTPTSPASVSSSSNRSSLADCDNLGAATPVSEAKSETQGAEHLH